MKNKIAILSISFTTNNVLYSLTDLNGNVIFWTSSGTKKTKGVKKATSLSVLASAKESCKYIYNSDYKQIYLKIKGFNKNKKSVIKYLNQSALSILFISEKMSFPHNGCKRSKKRRI